MFGRRSIRYSFAVLVTAKRSSDFLLYKRSEQVFRYVQVLQRRLASGFKAWGLGLGVWGLGFGVWGLGVGVRGLGFWVWGLGSRVRGWGLGVQALV
jgi:hypothetical protein